MVIGRARGNQGSVADYYSRDRSTPREGSFWGGEDDLTSAHAWEAEGKTFMRFTKKVGVGTIPSLASSPLSGHTGAGTRASRTMPSIKTINSSFMVTQGTGLEFPPLIWET